MLIVEPPTALAGSPGLSDIGVARAPAARIGPNTIIQLAHVLRERYGEYLASTLLFESTGYAMTALPGAMVDEREAQAFVQRVMQQLGERPGAQVLHEAGRRTADYLMANRIPQAAQWVMKALPTRAGLSLLLKAMQANAWTFAGSGAFSVRTHANGADLTFHACAMCRDMHSEGPVCDFYAGTFEHLIRTLVAPRAQVVEVECQAQGAHCCRFEVTGVR
jgi:divinyl protochlorophyllide a 8-vinyl-reductase